MSGRPQSAGADGPKAVWRALGYLRGYRAETGGALFGLLAVAVANLAAPKMIQLAVDGGLQPGHTDARTVVVAVLGLVGIAILRGLFNFLQGYLAERASQGVAYDMRDGLFARIQRLSFSYYDQAQTGQLLTRLTNDVEQVRVFVGSGVVQMAASLVMLVGCTGLLIYTNPVLAICALGALADRGAAQAIRRQDGPALREGADRPRPAQRRPAGGSPRTACGAGLLRRGARGRAVRPDQ